MGKHINKYLLPGEQIIHQAFYHWTHYISWISLFTLGLYPYLQTKAHEYIVSSKRVIIKRGILVHNSQEISLNRIESIQVEQSLLGRILGFGNITILGTGGTRESISSIKAPQQFRQGFMQVN